MVARDLGINPGTLGNWVDKDRASLGKSNAVSVHERADLKHLRSEVAELRLEHDVPKG